VEDWDLLDVAGSFESLSKEHDPHLRWAKHRRNRKLARRLKKRFSGIRWMDSPEKIPQAITCDQALLKAWLEDRNQRGVKDPPYFIGSSHGAMDHDPLAALLREGYGFIAWFTADSALPLPEPPGCDADEWERKDSFPHQLAANLRNHKPIIIWSEPDERGEFKMPTKFEDLNGVS
jgi:hypothetical protein